MPDINMMIKFNITRDEKDHVPLICCMKENSTFPIIFMPREHDLCLDMRKQLKNVRHVFSKNWR